MKLGRRELENAVNKYKKLTNRNFVLASKLSAKQLSNAVKHSGRRISEKDVVAFLDTTLFSSGKDGIILTERDILFTEHRYDGIDIQLVTKAEVNGNELKTYYPSGGFRKVKVSMYAEETAMLINAIARERILMEKAVLEKEAEIYNKPEEKKPEAPKKQETVKPAAKPTAAAEKPAAKSSVKANETYAYAGNEENFFYYANNLYNQGRKEEAFSWYMKSAEMGYPSSMCAAAEMIFCGEAGKNLEEKALDLIDEAKDCGEKMADKLEYKFRKDIAALREKRETKAAFDMAKMYLDEGLYFKAKEGFIKAAEAGHAEAMYELGILLESGKVIRDIDKAIFWLEKAKENGVYDGNDVLALIKNEKESLKNYQEEKKQPNVAPKKEETYSDLVDKALGGDTVAMRKCAYRCENSMDEKETEALFWYLEAARAGDGIAMANVGRMLQFGIGVPKNNKKALEWYKKSYSSEWDYEQLKKRLESGEIKEIPDPEEMEDFIEGCFAQGEMYYEVGFSSNDLMEAYISLSVAAEFEEAEAQYYLGEMFCEGRDFIKADTKKAKYWLEKAAKNGSENAENLLKNLEAGMFD